MTTTPIRHRDLAMRLIEEAIHALNSDRPNDVRYREENALVFVAITEALLAIEQGLADLAPPPLPPQPDLAPAFRQLRAACRSAYALLASGEVRVATPGAILHCMSELQQALDAAEAAWPQENTQ